ncbi:MAG: glycosyltransferase family 39 protein [Deltaproteobacteria bacterium]|nr:glycosyltransferase family 39 protein [Deltaproteobacteria bacterium]
MLFHHVITLFLLAAWWLITIGVGRCCLRLTTLRPVSRSEGAFLSIGIGLTLGGYLFFLLGLCHALHTPSLIIALVSLCFLAITGWLRPLPCSSASPVARASWDHPAAILVILLLIVDFLLVLTPELGKDALIYHLAVPKLYLLHHGFYTIQGNIFAGYPLLGEMHYLPALFFQGDILAKAIHFSLLGGILLGIGLFSHHVLCEQDFPALSILIFVSIPSVFAVSHMAYNDLFLTFFTLVAIYTILRWSEENDRYWLILCAFFCGSAAACKYTALLLLPLGSLGILWICRKRQSNTREVLGNIVLFAAVACLVGSPFYLKNWIMLGNPVYPFFYGIFGGQGWDADQSRLYDLFIQTLGMGKTLTDYLLLPVNVSFRAEMDSHRFDGILGPIFLLTLPFLVGIRHWEMPVRFILVYALAAFLFWASSAQQIRYLFPLLPLLSILVGFILTSYTDRKPVFFLIVAIIAGSLAFNGYHIAREYMKIRPLPVALGLESRDAFLTRLIPVYPMYRYVNQELPSESRIFLSYMKNFTYLCDRDCYSDALFETYTLQKILQASSAPQNVRDDLQRRGFTHLLYDEAYLLKDLSPLSKEEKQLFMAFRERHLTLIRQSGTYRLDRLD